MSHLPCCAGAASDMAETPALICLIVNILSPGLGTLISAIIDKKGCNWTGVGLAFLQAFLVPVLFIGWIWAIWHSLKEYKHSQNSGEAEGGEVDDHFKQVE